MESSSLFETLTENAMKRSPPLSVLHILAPAPVGGLESVVQMLAAGQHTAGQQVHVALILEPQDQNHPLANDLEQKGIDVKQIMLPPRAYWRERREIESLCRSLRPEVVHTHGYRSDIIAAPIARKLGIPTVTSVHGFAAGKWKNRFYEWLQCRAFRRFDAVVAVSQSIVNILNAAGVPPGKIHAIPNAWGREVSFCDRTEARQILGVPIDGFRVGWVGRLTQEKNAELFIRSIAQLRAFPLHASIIGDGRDRAVLQQMARKLKIEHLISWHGVMRDVARLLPAFDVLALTSKTEGTPIVLFEAMAAGVPIVATSVGGVPDILSPDEALLIPSEDSKALSEAIRSILEAPEQACKRVLAAHHRLSIQFSASAWIKQYEDVYSSVRIQ